MICEVKRINNYHDWKIPPVPNIDSTKNYPTVTKAQPQLIIPPNPLATPASNSINSPAIPEDSPSQAYNSDDEASNDSDHDSMQMEFNSCTTEIPPGSLFDDAAPPPSPTNVCDYPYFDHDLSAYKYSDGLLWTSHPNTNSHASNEQCRTSVCRV